MNTNIDTMTEVLADPKATDPITPHPSAPRWIFFDDERPSREERASRLEAIEAEEEVAANRPYPMYLKQTGHYQDDPGQDHDPNPGYIEGKKEWVDPEIDRYHARIEARRQEIWLAGNAGTIHEFRKAGREPQFTEASPGGWYGRNQKDNREDFIAKLVGLELNEFSFISKMRQMMAEDGIDQTKIEGLWERLSIYRLVRDILKKPVMPAFKKGDKADESEARASHRASHSDWKEIHQALNGHGSMDFLPRPPKHTLFLNPDGSKYLNKDQQTKSPMQAKIKFARRHKADEQRVMVERVVFVAESPILRQLNLPAKQTSLYVVSLRKLSNESPSTYYDQDPTFNERVDRDGNWTNEYQWQSGPLMKIPADTQVMPAGAHILSVRDLERAILCNAVFAEDDIDAFAATIENTDNSDDRLKTSDEFPRRDIAKLTEDEQNLYHALNNTENFDLADLITIDFDNERKETDLSTSLSTMAAAIYNMLQPSQSNQLWVDIGEDIYLTTLHRMTELRVEDPVAAAAKMTSRTMTQLKTFINSLNEEDGVGESA